MKRLLLLLALCLILTAQVVGEPLTFQNEIDVNHTWFIPTSVETYFSRNLSGGNQYIFNEGFGVVVQNRNAAPFTYLAWNTPPCGVGGISGNDMFLMDITNVTVLAEFRPAPPLTVCPAIERNEMTIIGSTARGYINGILYYTKTGLTQNPSFFRYMDRCGGCPQSNIDDIIMGDISTTSRYVVSMPAANGYYIKKDMINPSAYGLYNSTTGTLVSSNYMDTTFGRSTINGNASENLYLMNVDTGTVYETKSTGNATAGATAWDIASSLITSGAPYGRYQIRFGDFYSDEIAYIADGAAIYFDKDDYLRQDTATLTYEIYADYWDTSTYGYSMKLYSVNSWNVVSTQGISASTGTLTYQFTSDDEQGEYYAVLVAAPNVGGDDIWMNYDYAALTAYAQFSGYVNDAETELPISGANVSFSQNDIISNSITIADGNYTASGFLTGATLVINVTATGYSQYYASLTPMIAKAIPLNITLNSTTPTYTGLGIGGVARDGILTGTTITSGYGRPISGATVMLINTSNSESYTKTTNMAGWYLCDEGTSCFLTTGRPYDVWGEKIGYSNSQNYTAVAA